MKYLIILGIVLLILLCILYLIKRNRAIRKVKCTCLEDKVNLVNKVLKKFGFCFDVKQDIVVSLKENWQQKFGYSDLYDLGASSFNMVMDAEPILFDYQGKEYRIEFWKGQYGISTGAEIGVYVHDYKSHQKEGFYRAATKEECFQMGFLLFKKCFLFAREDYTWWLTGFDVGKFSNPKDLMLKVFIKFPNQEMMKAFIKSLLESGYTENKIQVQYNCVFFEICTPKNYKLNRHKIKKFFVQLKNRFNCFLFNFFTRFFPKTIDKLTFICFMFPHLYRFIIGFCVPKKKCHHSKKHRK